MNSAAENNIPTREALWEGIRAANAMRERRIAEQMAIRLRIGRDEINCGNPVPAQANQGFRKSGSVRHP